MFLHRSNCLSLILVYLNIFRILFIIKIMPIGRYTFSAPVFHEAESILDHKPCNTYALILVITVLTLTLFDMGAMMPPKMFLTSVPERSGGGS